MKDVLFFWVMNLKGTSALSYVECSEEFVVKNATILAPLADNSNPQHRSLYFSQKLERLRWSLKISLGAFPNLGPIFPRIGNGVGTLSTIGTRYRNSVLTASMPPKPMSKLSLN